VYQLVLELAKFVNEEHQFICNLDLYYLYFQSGLFRFFVAESIDNCVVGFALIYVAYSTWNGPQYLLEDFFVMPPYRQMGVGQLLFDQVVGAAREMGMRLIKLEVYDWNQNAINFYTKNGLVFDPEWWSCSLSIDSEFEIANVEGFSVRLANLDDVESIHELVRQLAVYENAEDKFIATVDIYKRDMENGTYTVMLIENQNEIVGMAFYFYIFSTWKGKSLYLEDFIISDQFRRRGLGKLLFDSLINEGKQNSCTTIKWQVLGWNEMAISFYNNYNCNFIKDRWLAKLFLHQKS